MIYFGTAKNAGDDFKTAYEDESNMSGVTINGKKYDSIEDYMEEINPTIVEPEHIEDWDYITESDGTITLNGYKGSDKEVVIPNYINGMPVKKLGFIVHGKAGGFSPVGTFWDPSICKGGTASWYWFSQNDITSVIIQNGIEVIGGFTFAFSSALTKVVIPKSVKTIDNQAFSSCTALTDITIPSSVISIGNNAFYNCKGLTEIIIPSSVIAMGEGVFKGIPSITVHVPWEEGKKPDGWNDNWNLTDTDCKIEVVYAE